MKLHGKKCVYFVGPMHHQRLVYPVLESLEKDGCNVVYITCNQEPPFERFCVDRKIPFKYEYEYMDSQLEDYINENFIAISKEFMNRYYREYVNTYWPLSIMSKILRWTVETYYIYEHMLKIEKPDFVIYQNEMNMWSEILGHIAYNTGIPAISFHEGSYYEDFFALRLHNSYSLNLLWGESVYRPIVRSGANPLRCIFVGNTHLDAELKNYDSGKIKKLKETFGLKMDKKTVMIIISLTDVPNDLLDRINNLLEVLGEIDSFNIILKHHPLAEGEQVKNFYSQLKAGKHKLLNLHGEEAYPYVAVSDVCITTGRSTLVMESLAFDKPIIDVSLIFGHDSYYKDLVLVPENYEQFKKHLKTALEVMSATKINERVKKAVEEEFGVIDGAIERASRQIKKTLEIKKNYNNLLTLNPENLFVYKKSDHVILSVVELYDAYIDKLFSLAKNLKEDSMYTTFINGKPMGLLYDISSKPIFSEVQEPDTITGIIITKESNLKKLGIVNYDEPLLSLMDLTNRAKHSGYSLKILPTNIDIDNFDVEARLYMLPTPDDAIKFYINNLMYLPKEVYREVYPA